MSEADAEWSAIDFINRTITSENGFTATLIDAIEEVILQVERVQELERLVSSHAPEGRNYTNAQYVKLLQENKRLKKALHVAFAHAVESQSDGTIDVITDTLQGLDYTDIWDADYEQGKKLFEEWMK